MASILRNIKVPVPIYWEFANTLEMPVLEKRYTMYFSVVEIITKPGSSQKIICF